MSTRLREKALSVFALLFAFGVVTLGHDVQASWTTMRFRPGSCELTVRVHAEAVRTHIQETAPGASFEPENIEKAMPALKSFGETLFEVSADGRTVAATGSDVSVVFDEFVFNLVYPRTSEGTLRLKATHLLRLSPEFIAHVRVTDESGKPLANHALKQNQPLVEIDPPSSAAQSGGVGRGSFLPFPNGYKLPLLLLGLLVVLPGVFWLVKRRIF
jgi:hypothetical protein